MNKPIVLVGYGGHGLVAAEILKETGEQIVGYCDNGHKVLNPFSIPYFGTEKGFFISRENCDSYSAFVSIGNAELRERIFMFLNSNNVFVVNAIHPRAVVSKTSTLGRGVFVAANAVINPLCTIGDGVICNTSSSIDHECVIGDFTHICPGTVLCGNVTIGRRSFIGANSTVLPGKTIGDNIIIGAGSTVVADILQPGTYAGSPAKLLHTLKT